MKILFIHQGMPGQFAELIKLCRSKGDDVYGVGMQEVNNKAIFNEYWKYTPTSGTTEAAFPIIHEAETKSIRGYHCFNLLKKKKEQGFSPDIIYAHPGWGESLYVKHLWPNIPLITFQEFFYSLINSDLDYDPEFNNSENDSIAPFRLEFKNALALQSVFQSDACISPTYWQASQFPQSINKKFIVQHEGVNLSGIDQILNSKIVSPFYRKNVPYVTYMARNLEPYRGFHSFMRAAKVILSLDKSINIFIIGSESGRGYGSGAPNKQSWKQYLNAELASTINNKRVHFLGPLSYQDYILTVSKSLAHIYLSYPFVLSWSVLEVMYLKIPIIVNDIPMNSELIEDNVTGYHCDFFSPRDIANKVINTLNGSQSQNICNNAHQKIKDSYDSVKCSKLIRDILIANVSN